MRDIYYDTVGSGKEVLLCLSGFGCSNYNYEFLKNLLGKDFKLILIDNRGMGKSDLAKDHYLIDDLAQDAILLMQKLKIESYHVMGISMGGFIAQKMALLAPQNIKSLILGCTTSGGDSFPNVNKLDEKSIRKSFSLGAEVYNRAVVEATVHPSTKSNHNSRYEDIYHLRVKHMPVLDQVLLQQYAVDKFLDEKLSLESINCPTLILTGDEDRFISLDHSIKLNKSIQNSKLNIIENSDHHFFLEQPEVTASLVTKFMRQESVC